MGQERKSLTPSGSKRIRETLEVIHPFPGDSAVDRIIAESKIADQHGRTAECFVEGVGVNSLAGEGLELQSTGRALGQGPVVLEETGEVVWQGPQLDNTRKRTETGWSEWTSYRCSTLLASWTR